MKHPLFSFLTFLSIICPIFLIAKMGVDTKPDTKSETEKTEKSQGDGNGNEVNGEGKDTEQTKTASADKKEDHSNGDKQGGTEEAEKTLKIGNLAFPPSQQPSPLVSFGQNIIDRKGLQAQITTSDLQGEHQYFITINPGLIYAFTDNFSLFLVSPFAIRYRQDHHHSSGPGDMIVQLEYAFYTKAYRTFYDQATIVANVTIPTGSTKKKPPTGVGANSFFIGGTYSRMEIDWFYFVSSGGVFPTSSHRTKFGNQLLYQFGFGRRITNTDEWLFDWMIEIDGTYSWKNVICGETDPNSGGNVIFLTPSLWISTKESFVVQFGIGVSIQQHLFGHQNKDKYVLLMTTDWLF